MIIQEPALIHTLQELSMTEEDGRQLNCFDYLASFARLNTMTPMHTMEPFLPLLFNFQKGPLTLKDHFVFSPLFYTDSPQSLILMAGRQVGKSVGAGGSLAGRSALIPGFQTLYTTPLGEQMKRFSVNYVKALIGGSPLSRWMVEGCKQNIEYKEFKNGSRIQFSFASDSADRIRGIMADEVFFDELQDFCLDNLPVIESVLSHSDWGLKVYTGTPKTMDNTLTLHWKKSSQAEWWVPCRHCGEWNIPSLDYHLEEMIGDWREDISEEAPGTVCHKCKKPISPREGRWVHRYPARRKEFSGYHIPQILLPHHYAFPHTWQKLLVKRDNWPTAQYYNEVLGEPYDIGQTLLTQAELISACQLPWKNDPREPSPLVTQRLGNYVATALSADWGGGGMEEVSFTVLALLGMTADGTIHVLWGKRFSGGIDHNAEALDCYNWTRRFNPTLFVHDYSGAGAVRETILIHSGFPYNSTIPIEYTGPHKQNLMVKIPANEAHSREHYTLDRTRSLYMTVHCIKRRKIQFFAYDGGADAHNIAGISTSLLDDLLALTEEKTTSVFGQERALIRRQAGRSDDFAHAVNMGVNALWNLTGNYPSFALDGAPTTLQVDESLADAIYMDSIF